jgi:hypothetical protein
VEGVGIGEIGAGLYMCMYVCRSGMDVLYCTVTSGERTLCIQMCADLVLGSKIGIGFECYF